VSRETFSNPKQNMSKVKHIVLLKFKSDTTPAQIEDTFNLLLEITEAIPGIEDYVSGENNSPESLSQGYTHGVVMTFSDAAARDAYLSHEEHGRFKTAALPLIETVAVLDFEV